MTYRIAMTGAQGTGKSTLARAVCTALRDAGVADVRQSAGLGAHLAQTGFRTGARASAETVRHFAQAHIAREASTLGAVQVFDRCLLDTLAYARVLGCLPHAEFSALSRATAASSARFSELIWLRVTHDYPELNESDESPAFRRAIDTAIGALAREHGIQLREQAVPPDSIAALAVQIVGRCLEAQR
jgi:predicted ATPase